MKLFNLSTLAILSFTSSTAYAGCYPAGIDGFKQPAYDNIEGLCKTLFSGNYSPGMIRSACLDAGNDHYDFYARNIKKTGNSMDWATCTQKMKDMINCQKGGESDYNDIGWNFRADPNSGPCLH
ncbi:hypothetical protein DSL72_009026 [Monilinia vaccinii-corymbosi]|uniref:Glycan binding protein Y3-like domain-containing protein n=1 Tax=Monilinia vaccinii-corymbosi TaxID=61207 RepID=A0A8A3PPW9_9HELO|nr:hypothetical protein DSL72_009026 [Monilinia vaccinii-corymbosi]